ncbi:MAG: OprO/OprP family phosphate-selective porin [Bacteroidales bacterium]|nr:OprO/OprP family phosphate-selective porin [Bacteroidales bacterium]
MHRKLLIVFPLFLMGVLPVSAQGGAGGDDTGHTRESLYKPVLGGTVRAKYEWQTEIGKGRFQVRTARLSVAGNVLPRVGYKAEVDFSDKGRIKMLDAYTFLNPWKDLKFTIGQMRVPFTIDAHRGPYLQYFPNRSFIAKQVGSVRDVGATVRYDLPSSFPIILEGGLFNGSGLTNQNDFWTEHINFSAKVQFFFPKGFNLTLSTQKTTPGIAKVMMYDAGTYWEQGPFHIEAEYLYKHYEDNLFPGVHSYNLFGVYTFDLPKGPFRTLSALARYDYMGNHSDGVPDETGALFPGDAERSRLTVGLTLSFLHNRLISNIRINFEKYFYTQPELARISEKDKLVIEFMTHF